MSKTEFFAFRPRDVLGGMFAYLIITLGILIIFSIFYASETTYNILNLIIGFVLLISGYAIAEEFRSNWRRFGITITIWEEFSSFVRRVLKYPPPSPRPEWKLTLIDKEKQRFIQMQNLYEFSKKALYVVLPPFAPTGRTV